MKVKLKKEWFSAPELARMRLPGLPGATSNMLRAIERWSWATQYNGRKCRKRRGRGGGLEYHYSLLLEPARDIVIAKYAKQKTSALKRKEDRLLNRQEKILVEFLKILSRQEYLHLLQRGTELCNDLRIVARNNAIEPPC